uniref:Reducing polyketide synthase Preu2 n=1 Tax=Preussia isomera TaxID=325670 RepID=PREU2_PREIS|nr:RecName: Full=Reducing polyketide synthase Preu2; AltName: Full=biosynthesis protein Preu2 [Preussia isomera]UNY67714.1 polyketide synthase Preu2 [Preussia isomera]
MMAVHLAVASLRRNESTIAFACGTHLNLEPNDWVSLTKMNMISPDGRSKMFDELANGYGRGEGIGVICLKRLDAAIRDGDHIECVIRETGTNQDGHTKGITAPSAEAQAALIRKTYRSAGLDPTQVGSRPSFFEAHGTGTHVGDPLEAKAIQAAFFPPGQEYSDDEVLYIGSVKTIVGHTEGTAGIAGLLRAALAVRYGSIPPNLLYTRMNAEVAQYANHLRVVTAANPWPTLPVGCPRRASVNSFGFGGSNVHVIVESYVNTAARRVTSIPSFGAREPIFTPFTFSAISERALMSLMEKYLKYLEDPKSSVSPRDLAWTMQYKRSEFPFRSAMSALTVEDLRKQLRKATDILSDESNTSHIIRASQSTQPLIMAIFTGQGAQWPGMGKDIIEQSPHACDIIARLDDSLASLPEDDRPTWKIREELAIDSSRSRMDEAALSQPLTTAVQILLVDLLDIAGVKVRTVVGHSSGEIAAAYAAGMITAEDAIRVAYYRGLHSKLAGGVAGQKGAMITTFLTPNQAVDLCNLPEFRGRIVPAAFNGPTAVTLSGDVDAVERVLLMLEAQNIFARKLNVEKAYHSHHMKACAPPYIQSLEQCGVPVMPPFMDSPIWFSSVNPGKRMDPQKALHGSYWAENLLSPVRFSDAITTAISETGVPDIFLEIGPHPALMKPVLQIISDVAKDGTVYSGLLKRSSNSILSFSNAMGSIWERFGRCAVNFSKLETTLSGGSPPVPAKDLPTYPWLHDREYWWENRWLRRRFEAAYPPNELLGEELSMGAQHETKWRSFLQPKDVPWLLDHKLNGVAVLPGAAYVAMAATAARRIYRKQTIIMIELNDLSFKLPITFPDDHTSIETVLTVVNIRSTTQQGQADFVFDFCSHQRQDELMTAARGSLTVQFGDDVNRTYPERLSQHSALTELDLDTFYNNLEGRGYNYTGPFRSITSLQRRMNFSTGRMDFTPSDMTFHPALLDGLFQATFAAENYPGDSAMLDFRVPSLVRSIKVFPARCDEMTAMMKEKVDFQVSRTGPSEYSGLLLCENGSGTAIQMDGFCTAPFRMSTPEEDVKMFSEVAWRQYVRDARSLTSICVLAAHEKEPTLACERVGFYYLRRLNETIPPEEEKQAAPHLRRLLEFARMVVCENLLGLLSHMSPEWIHDTEADIAKIIAEYSKLIDMRLVDAVGRAYPSIIRGHVSALSVLTEDGMLTQLYSEGLGFYQANSTMTRLVSTISNQYPNIHILEVGAGTGSATSGILPTTSYSSYTFTDVSPAFLATAKDKFRRYSDKMAFTTLDLDKDFEDQGFTANSFEVIVASNVLHAVTDINASLIRIRRLLRPGGYLVCTELPESYCVKTTVIMGALPGWWQGAPRGRNWSPALTEPQWDRVLKDTGFAGLDAISPLDNDLSQSYRVFVAQAVDERVVSLRDPLTHPPSRSHDSIMIIGCESLVKSQFLEQAGQILLPSFQDVIHVPRLEEITQDVTVPYSVLCLAELGKPVFQDMTAAKWSALQTLLGQATDIIWVTTGHKSPKKVEESYKSMAIGLGRVVRNELRDLRLRFVDVDDLNTLTARSVSQATLEWYMLGQWAAQGWGNQVLFPHDTELAFENGLILAPSVVHSKTKNDHYNSQQRRIVREAQPYRVPIELVYSLSTKQYDLHEAHHVPAYALEDTITMKILYTTLYALKLKKVGFLFIGMGICPDGKYALVVSEKNGSILRLPRHTVYPFTSSRKPTQRDLWITAARIIAGRVVSGCNLTGKLLVLVTDATLLTIIRDEATRQHKSVVFITSNPNFASKQALFLHHSALDVQVRQSIPSQIGLLVNLSNRLDDKNLFKRVRSVLRDTCTEIKTIDAILRTTSSRYWSPETLGEIKVDVVDEKYLMETANMPGNMSNQAEPTILSPKNVSKQAFNNPLTVLDWTVTTHIPVTIQPATAIAKFSGNKCYIIIGTSDLAQSVCELMVSNGAKYVVMASRNPTRLSGWVQDMASRGAYIDIKSVDVTDAMSVRKMFSSIRNLTNDRGTSAPPIAGLVHMGLGLKDAAFSALTFEDLQIATDVKAKGSLLLHEQLQEEKLDFFILTSSISYVAGNPGQANYSCANAFMAGLANYRRDMGLAASVVHLGHVAGVGYITRMSQARGVVMEDARKHGLLPISERDLHQIYAEAVLASPADSGRNPEIITGFPELTSDMLESSVWGKQPIFTHLVTAGTRPSTIVQPKPHLSVRERLNNQLSSTITSAPEKAESSSHDIIRNGLVERLSVLLQVDVKQIDEDISLLDMGIDSLVASEIGSWARKELRVQIPHSMIFGGASVANIVDFAVAHLDKEWLALKNGSGEGVGKGK